MGDNYGNLEPIAIIGLACRFPGGANSPEELWQMLSKGESGWSEIPADRYNWRSFHHPDPDSDAAHNQKGGGYINKDLAAFDAAFFNIPAAEANALDPQQRIQLETAYEALENAGIPVDSVRGSKTSVHVATVSRDYDRNAYRDPQDLAKYHLTGCGEAITSGRVSYTFDFRGPCFSLDTGCSGSLVGIHLAVQGLRSRETDMALVGGTNLLLSPDMTIAMSKLHMLNDDGKCYAFDSRGKGYARSEGVSTIVLKRLSDAVKAGDPVRAIIRQTGINQDGKTNGIMLPNPQAQEDLMRSIHVDAGLDPSQTAYVEAHGTGTLAGDKAEIASISKVFCTGVERERPLFVGSIKANFGHCESASSLAGVIKTVLALENGLIPATPDVMNIKEGLDLDEKNIRIPQILEPWPLHGVRRAAVNSFGYGGTNVAAVLESYQPDVDSIEEGDPAVEINGTNNTTTDFAVKPQHDNDLLFVVSAKAPKSLIGNLESLRTWIQNQEHVSNDTLRHLAYTLSSRRSNFPFRSSFLAGTAENFLSAATKATKQQSEKASTKPTLSFVFTGQGAQWYAMGRELMHTQSTFAVSLKRSEILLKDLGATWSLYDELSRCQDTSRINESEISQPATTAIQIALVDLLESLGVRADSVIGHSSGEIAAAYAIGVLSHESALCASYHRSKVSELAKRRTAGVRGGMLVTSLGAPEAQEYIDFIGKGRLSLACINSPSSTTISGDMDAVEELKTMLDGQSVMAKVLAVDVAYHSHHMKAVADCYLDALSNMETSTPRDNTRFFSSVTSELKTSGFGAEYWVENLVSTVRFSDALLMSCKTPSSSTSSRASSRILLEIGPHSALAGPSKQTLTSGANTYDHKYLSALVRGKNAYSTLATLAGKLFELGFNVNVEAVNTINGSTKLRDMILDLPPYAWDYSNRYWHESRLSKEYRFRKHPYHDLLGLRLIGSTLLEPIWRNILSIDAQPWLNEHIIDGFSILPGASFLTMAIEAARQLNEERGAPKIKKFHLKKINYYKPIMIPESPDKVEVMLSLTAPESNGPVPSGSSEWETFKITSSRNAKMWDLNCRGYIRLEYDSVPNEVDFGREEQRCVSDLRQQYSQTESSCTRSIEHDALYTEMRENGIDYGTNFATIQELRIGDCLAFGKVVIPDVAQCMPSKYQQPHTIHPATFDALMHIVLPLYFRHCTVGTAMLTAIEEVSVNADMVSAPGGQLDVCAALCPAGPRSGSVDVTAFQTGLDGPYPVVTLRGQKFQGIANSVSEGPVTYASSLFHNVRRPLQMTIATPGVISSLCFVDDEAAKILLQPDEVQIKALAFALDKVDVDVMLGKSSDMSSIGQCAGIITSLGSDLKHAFQIGDRVCCWNTTVAFASETRVKGALAQRLPDSWSIQMGAALPQNISLAYYGLHGCTNVVAGQTILVHGAGLALGQAVILVARSLDLQIIATVKSRAEMEALSTLKPAHVLFTDDPALPKALLRLTKGAGVDAIFNATSSVLTEELMRSIAPFGSVIDIHGHSASSSLVDRAIKYVSFDAAQLLRHRLSAASTTFKNAISLLADENLEQLLPLTVVPIEEVASAFKTVQAQSHTGQVVLMVGEDSIVNVKESTAPLNTLAGIDRIVETITGLSIPQEQKSALLALIAQSSAAGSDPSCLPSTNGNPSSASHGKITAQRRLATASSMAEVNQIVLDELTQKMVSLVTISADQLDPYEPLSDLGLDSLIVIEFRSWLGRTLGADVRAHDILDSAGLNSLAGLIALTSSFVPAGLPDVSTDHTIGTPEEDSPLLNSKIAKSLTTGSNRTNISSGTTTPGDAASSSDTAISSIASVYGTAAPKDRFIPNRLPDFPLPNIDVLFDSFLAGVKAFATASEFTDTMRAVQAFKQPGSTGRLLYDRAAARVADPAVENWEFEPQLQRGFLDRRASLTPWVSFWSSHQLSKRQHSQVERAALLTHTVRNFKLELEAGLVHPMLLNEQELTTAFHKYIFGTVRIPGIARDTIQTQPSADYCVAFWRGHPFKVSLSSQGQAISYNELRGAFENILSRSSIRSVVPVLASDNRTSWAETRQQLQQLNPMNAANIAAIEAAAFIICLDEATPTTPGERARQFQFGGKDDLGNRWHDKSLQFVICSNGVSATIGEHTMLDAMTLNQMNDAIANAIEHHPQAESRALLSSTSTATVEPVPLPLKTDAALETHIEKVRAKYADNFKDADHLYYSFEGYGAKWLREQKLSPKSVFQMVVQLATYSLFGYTPPCWETVNQAHYHQGRVDIVQVVVPQVAAFLIAARDPSVTMNQRRALLVEATRAHVACINKAGRNLGWERNLQALRVLLKEGEELPALYKDSVYQRLRPRLMMSHCFEAGMMEKGCMLEDRDAVWSHYEVYDENVYFSVVTLEKNRATRFCGYLREAAELVRQIVLA